MAPPRHGSLGGSGGGMYNVAKCFKMANNEKQNFNLLNALKQMLQFVLVSEYMVVV